VRVLQGYLQACGTDLAEFFYGPLPINQTRRQREYHSKLQALLQNDTTSLVVTKVLDSFMTSIQASLTALVQPIRVQAQRARAQHEGGQERHGQPNAQCFPSNLKRFTMKRFKPNDVVFILPRYVPLYPGHSAVVTGVTADPFNPMFNEYALEFPDRSRANLFEFQIIEDLLNYTTFIASLVFDNREHPAPPGTRGLSSGRQVILQTPGYDLDMTIHTTKSRASALGQILERGTNNLLKDLEVRLMKETMPTATAVSDSHGVFEFSDCPRGSLHILVVIPQSFSRILGAFSI